MKGAKLVGTSAENLGQVLEPSSFDVVFCNNALDHTQSPRVSLENMVKVVRNNGYIVIAGHSMEGTHENWDGIHMHDLYVEGGQLWRSGENEPGVILNHSLPLDVTYFVEPSEQHGRMVIVFYKL